VEEALVAAQESPESQGDNLFFWLQGKILFGVSYRAFIH
jgi:hypothetical protein